MGGWWRDPMGWAGAEWDKWGDWDLTRNEVTGLLRLMRPSKSQPWHRQARIGLWWVGCVWFCAALAGATTAPASALPPLPAAELSASFGVSTPEAQRMRSDQLAGLAKTIAARRLPVFSLLISRNGKLVFELYSSSLGCDEAHYLMSVTKSVTAALMGIAIDEGKVRSAEAALPEVLPASVFADGAERQRFAGLTVKEVLGMSALNALQPPHATDADAVERARQTGASQDHFRFALTQRLLPETGGQYQYNDLTPMLATGVIQYGAKRPLLQFAQTPCLARWAFAIRSGCTRMPPVSTTAPMGCGCGRWTCRNSACCSFAAAPGTAGS